MNKTLYSINNEDFTWEDIDEVRDAFVCEDIEPLGKTYYECEFRPLTFFDALPAALMLEIADERADELYGHPDYDYETIIETTKEGVAELDKLLTEWAEKHLNTSRHMVPAGTPVERVIDEQDLSRKGD